MKALNVVDMPLAGRSLIEASAGTGKTYTISNIVLRLILQAQDNLSSNPLKIGDILIVTFTKAATEELKDRVREKVTQAQIYIDSRQSTDDVLKHIVDQAVLAEGESIIRKRCREASLYLDDAPIFTIHGFCQRLLVEHSFSTGRPYTLTLMENNQTLLRHLSEKLWREKFYAIDQAYASFVSSMFDHPEALYRRLDTLLDDHLYDAVDYDLEVLVDAIKESYQQAASIWAEEEQTITAMFDGGLGGNVYKKNLLPKWLAQLNQYLRTDQQALLSFANLYRFSPSLLSTTDKAPTHRLFVIIETLVSHLRSIKPAFMQDLRLAYIHHVTQHKSDQGLLFFDDLVKNVALSLTPGSHSSEALRSQILKQYPVAIIDEFQDTDLWQYHIFQFVYHQQQSMALLMIGDPKQAIYSFRGADIHTYFKARNDVVEEKRYTLMTNWRSKPALVENINRLFSLQADAFFQKEFPPYNKVQSPQSFSSLQGLATLEGEATLSVLTLDSDEKTAIKVTRHQAAEKTAIYISELLNKSIRLNRKTIQPKDIAILVRNRTQAIIMKAALAACNVNSIYMAKESVLSTEEAQAFMVLLKACANPYDMTAIYNALADTLLLYDASSLQKIQSEALQFQKVQRHFLIAYELWHAQGFMSMWEYIVRKYEVLEKLLSCEDGERRVTNLNQIAEIFQKINQGKLDFEQQLERFQQHMLGFLDDSEHQKLRLETEANLVEIVTIHKSKGLQYPLVCCPFLFDSSSPAEKTMKNETVIFDQQLQRHLLYWYPDENVLKKRRISEFSESIRLLYVALTRAEFHLNICWGRAKNIDNSALYHLLYHRQNALKALDEEQFWQIFKGFDNCVIDPNFVAESCLVTEHDQQEPLSSPSFNRQLDAPFIARSYSAMLLNTQTSVVNNAMVFDSDNMVFDSDNDETDNLQSLEKAAFSANIFHFPRGATPGNFLHQIFENIDFQHHVNELPDEVKRLLVYYGFDHMLWSQAIVQHISSCLTIPLLEANCCLADLSASQLAKEMNFHINAKHIDGQQLSRALSRYRSGEAVPVFASIEGLFKGFIDLVFESDGKYYVLDYKSNFLGYDNSSYHQQAMHESMLEHFYDLQYIIYLAVLQRYLKHRLPDYDFEQHIGGVYYLFLRGMNDKNTNGIYFVRPSRKIIDAFESFFYESEFIDDLAGIM